MVRKNLSLIPADRLAEEDLAALSLTAQLLVDVRKPRSPQHHRLLFALLRKVAQSTPTPLSENALLSWVKVRTGHVEHVPLGFGRSYEAPASIAFGNMDQAEFGLFFDRVADLICAEIVPGLGKPELLREIEDMLGQREAA
jgi:hypothetical protein